MAQKIVISQIFRNNLKGNFALCLKCNAIIIHSKDELVHKLSTDLQFVMKGSSYVEQRMALCTYLAKEMAFPSKMDL